MMKSGETVYKTEPKGMQTLVLKNFLISNAGSFIIYRNIDFSICSGLLFCSFYPDTYLHQLL